MPKQLQVQGQADLPLQRGGIAKAGSHSVKAPITPGIQPWHSLTTRQQHAAAKARPYKPISKGLFLQQFVGLQIQKILFRRHFT